MKTIIKHSSKSFLILAFYFLGTFVFAQVISSNTSNTSKRCNYKSTLNVSTGYNPSTNTILTMSNNISTVLDPMWRLVNLPLMVNGSNLPPQIQLNQSYIIRRFNNYWCNNNDSPASEQPISVNNSASFGLNNLNAMQPFRFVREFCLKNDERINFNLRIKSDDAARVSLYEGNNPIPIFSYTTVTGVNGAFYQPTSTYHANFGTGSPVHGWQYNQSHNLSAGAYTLEIQMINKNGTAMGVTMSGIVSSENGKDVLSNDQGCCDVGTIAVHKIFDANCNGKYDLGENAMEGIAFNLLNSIGQIIRTGITDQYGELYFYNVPYGNYTVQEVVPTGYTPFETNQYQVVVNSDIQSHYLRFYNCEKKFSTTGAFCCNSDNLIKNGNFEAGNTGFYSDYIQNTSVYPGEYSVSTSSAAFGHIVTDHSYCADNVLYSNNQNYLLVNGQTQQNGQSVIWGNKLDGLEIGASYKICANFKNIPQCTFDVLPKITIQVDDEISGSYTINTSDDACDWQNLEFTFTANSSSVSIEFLLDEMGNGDGNDLAIDDIGLFKITQPELDITVQHQGSNNQIIASINSIDISDDVLPVPCEKYNWFVAEVISVNGGNVVLGTITSGSAPNWNLTTTFLGYTFNPNMLYYVGFYIPECKCFKEALVYQLTLSSNSIVQDPGLTLEQEKQIIKAIENGDSDKKIDSKTPQILNKKIVIYPNPSSGIVNFTIEKDLNVKSIDVYDVSGKLVLKPHLNYNSINLTQLLNGIYFLKFNFQDGISMSEKFIKK
ncbi:T9SS type A sorting domain-containing protein [Algoriella sp.]|uniref:T9SS type A sorting domain-containing protein n=1 Tax=Algoriella sp. TaxID=1872434 RepID=UPI001B2F8086|nr:T9SS type A sorting domain-containing protein [Algoriella sp.]MBO6213784.1 T9SS type A sorting domain-containing protein [Algoriella sp.]